MAVFIALAGTATGLGVVAARAADPTPMDSDNGIWVAENDVAKLTLTKDGSRPTAQLSTKKSKQTFDCIEIAISKSGAVDMWCGQKNHGLRTQGFLIHGTYPALTIQPGGDYSAGTEQGPLPATYQGPASK